jgi:hypothetical protein
MYHSEYQSIYKTILVKIPITHFTLDKKPDMPCTVKCGWYLALLLHRSTFKTLRIVLQWIYSHCGVHDNE